MKNSKDQLGRNKMTSFIKRVNKLANDIVADLSPYPKIVQAMILAIGVMSAMSVGFLVGMLVLLFALVVVTGFMEIPYLFKTFITLSIVFYIILKWFVKPELKEIK
jgi:hypothetical protein